jgi:hypothetical protein
MFEFLDNCEGIKVGELYTALNQANKIDDKENLINYKNKTIHAKYFYSSKTNYLNLMHEYLKNGWTIIYDTMEYELTYPIKFNLGLKNV